MNSLQPPSPCGLLSEGLGLLELPRLLLMFSATKQARVDDVRPVMVLPGFESGDESTIMLRLYLERRGYKCRSWQWGRNSGEAPEYIPRVIHEVSDLVAESGSEVSLIGWSLGGFLAREAARERPDLVHSVITLGSPVIGGPRYTAIAPIYEARGYDLDAIEAWVRDHTAVPIKVSVTAIYSRLDGIVSWQSCLDENEPMVDYVEVQTTHLGLGFSPEVYRIIAKRLSSPPILESPHARTRTHN
jgi:pimeloyl-ACP methyl ester carboxylesterase